MRKKIIYLLIITFVCVLLSGCVHGDADETSLQFQNETETETETEAETEIAIEEDAEMEVKYLMTEDELEWLNSMIGYYKLGDTPEEAVEHKDYHGKIGDCFIISNDFELGTASVIIVGDYKFAYLEFSYSVLHPTGDYSVFRAYMDGILSQNEVGELNDYHCRMYGDHLGGKVTPKDYVIFEDGPIKLTDEETIEIVQAFFTCERPYYLSYSHPHINLSCFAKFEDSYAVFIKSESDIVSEKPYTQIVNGVELTYPTGQWIRICYDGKIYLLQEAFDAGIINSDELKMLAETLKNWSEKK